jgi:pimeloyl-ACP methyl ester carboxylesterase
MPNVRHSTVRVGPANVFYREAGTPGQPVLLLLHGFANSSHYFRHLMPRLAGRFHLIASDLPSFGFTTLEEGEGDQFTFAGLTKTIQGFVNELSLRRFAMYVFDYGAPVGFNLAVDNPDSITAIVSQSANAYEEGLGDAPWAPLRAYWKRPSPAIHEQIKEARPSFTMESRVLLSSVSNTGCSLLAPCVSVRRTGPPGSLRLSIVFRMGCRKCCCDRRKRSHMPDAGRVSHHAFASLSGFRRREFPQMSASIEYCPEPRSKSQCNLLRQTDQRIGRRTLSRK